jgi:alkylhydroperoxidase family enzyme
MNARIAPLSPPYEPAVGAQLAKMMPPGIEPIGLFRTFARNLPMATALGPWGGYALSKRFSLSLRQREIVIDRVCARCGCEYEWGVHIAFFADAAGLTTAQQHSVTHGSATDACWDQPDALLIEMVDSLHDTSDVDDALWQRAAQTFTAEQLLDILMLSGWYHAISYTARATRVALEPGAPRLVDV